MAHQTYNTMGYNQRGVPMTGMGPVGSMNNYNSMNSMNQMVPNVNTMNSMSNVNQMNHMMMSSNNSNNINSINSMNNINHMSSLSNMGNSLNQNSAASAMSMNKMTMQQQSQQAYGRRVAPYPNPAMHQTQKRMAQHGMSYGGTNPTMPHSGYGPVNTAAQQFPNGYGSMRSSFQTQQQHQLQQQQQYQQQQSQMQHTQMQQSQIQQTQLQQSQLQHAQLQQSQLQQTQLQQSQLQERQLQERQMQQTQFQQTQMQQMNSGVMPTTGYPGGNTMATNPVNSRRQQTLPGYASTQQTSQYYSTHQTNPNAPVNIHQSSGVGLSSVHNPSISNQYIGSHQQQSSMYSNSGVSSSPYVNNNIVPGQYPQEAAPLRAPVQGTGNLNYQHSPVPGNPTPPLTPASNMQPYVSPNSDGKVGFGMDMKSKEDEMRLTFPVRDGIILPPFRLEHNLAVSNHVFHLKSTVHQTLMWRQDLELQLKCFHHEDRQMNTNWPQSVLVSVNATPLVIDRGENKSSHKPLYLKDVCQSGRNTIQITVAACCCSHLFVLQLVHRPSVQSVLDGLLRKRLLTAEHGVTKIKRNFSSAVLSNGGISTEKDLVEQTSVKMSLKCPITFKRITLPARGQECKHIQCFDLESYLQLNAERNSWRCPVCTKPAQLEGLEVDQYIWGILSNTKSPDIEEVTIDSQANWKPKKSDEETDANKKLIKAMSPGSTNMPSMNSWMDNHQAMSPYMNSMDMNSIVSGSMINHNNSPSQQQHSPYNTVRSNNPGPHTPNSANDFNNSGPMSHLTDSTNPLDHLNAIDKSLSDQMPHTPHTPGNAGGNSGPPSVAPASVTQSQDTSGGNLNTSTNSSVPGVNDTSDIMSADLNFDPAAVIEGEAAGQETLNLLPDNVLDPNELLSYFEPPDLNTPPSSGASSGNPSSNDDFFALFAE